MIEKNNEQINNWANYFIKNKLIKIKKSNKNYKKMKTKPKSIICTNNNIHLYIILIGCSKEQLEFSNSNAHILFEIFKFHIFFPAPFFL